MQEDLNIKADLFKLCETSIRTRIKTLEEALKSIAESRDNETKSSAGDKYETGRAMMQIEEAKNNTQLAQAQEVMHELMRIDLDGQSSSIGLGSLVKTNGGTYFLAIGLGKVHWEGQLYFCISVNSPIGQLLLHKKAGDTVVFNGRKIQIEVVS